MSNNIDQAPADARADALANFLGITDTTLAVLEDERVVFLTGAYQKVPDIIGRKQALLAELDASMPHAPKVEQVMTAMRRLIASSRRNEQIIEAARQGLAHAKRRIAKIREAGRGAVAYAEDGSRIASRADLIGGGKSA